MSPSVLHMQAPAGGGENAVSDGVTPVHAPTIRALALPSANVADLHGQVIHLDFDGATDASYRGLFRIDGIDVPEFATPESLRGQRETLIQSMVDSLNDEFREAGVSFTRTVPESGLYSTIYVGGDDSAFARYGSFLGLAEHVDAGNQDRGDNAFVFSEKVFRSGMSAQVFASALAEVIGHEARHLLGYGHLEGETAGLGGVAAGISPLPDGALITVNSDADTNVRDGFLTLREAILVNNRTLAVSSLTDQEKAQVAGSPSDTTRDWIGFSIGDGGVQTIFVTGGGLPFITDPVIIDGTSQPGFDYGTNRPIIEIDASGAGRNEIGQFAAGIEITGGNSVVKGLVINGAPQDGILLRNGGENTISGNLIGSFLASDLADVSGVFGNANGIAVRNSANNQIGGVTGAERNVISGNRYSGIVISDSGSTGNQVQGNWIGTEVTGQLALGNGLQGVLITAPVGQQNYASGSLIGGAGPGEGNVISGNKEGVVIVRGESNVIQGNLIGTTPDGTGRLGNVLNGIQIIDSRWAVIGGQGLAGNVISANGLNGISITGGNATGTRVENNRIGTDITGLDRLGNAQDGVFIGQFTVDPSTNPITPPVTGAPFQNTIGGPSAQLKNIISSNLRDGVHLEGGARDNKIEGNYIGLAFDGDTPLPNLGDGVAILDSPNNTVGGTVVQSGGLFPRNVISSNGGHGVHIIGTGATQNVVIGNYIGLDWTGEFPRGNGAGVYIDIGASDNIVGSTVETIGGTTFDDRNVISGNAYGVVLVGSSNSLVGNLIGTDFSGLVPVGNRLGGVNAIGSFNVIGGAGLGMGNVISGNLGFGVRLGSPGTGNTVLGNFIGTDKTGFVRLGNAADGVLIDNASGNTVGGPATPLGFEPGNVISANQGNGVTITGAGASGNAVTGNIIGLNDSGQGLMGNAGNGVHIKDAHDNTIGGTAEGAGNLISGNDQRGIEILRGGRNHVLGNLIGTDIDATFALGNLIAGILIQDSERNDIGGAAVGARNIISGNGFGVSILGAASQLNSVRGNRIGTDGSGLFRLGNQEDGVIIALGASANIIGGTPEEGNVISANFRSGVRIADRETFKNVVRSNSIGVGADGTTRLGNNEHGVLIEGANDNDIGVAANGGNVIAFNGSSLAQRGHGVVVTKGTGNHISRNSIYQNAGRGIDLGTDNTFTPNDPGDADIGANNLQNYPFVAFVNYHGAFKDITWNLNSTPNIERCTSAGIQD